MTESTPELPVYSDEVPTLDSIRTNWLDLFYAAMFHPVRTFKSIAAEEQPGNRLLFYALLSVLLVSVTAPMVHIANVGGSPSGLVVSMPFSALVGLLIWGFMALVIALLAYAFSGEARIRTFLILSGLATLPWIFMGPISLFKIGIGVTGLVLCALLGLIVWLWTIVLFALAIMTTYRMTAERVLIVLATPFAMMMVFIGWIVGFIRNIIHLTP
jgi:hypothetical protein